MLCVILLIGLNSIEAFLDTETFTEAEQRMEIVN
jgi:hypothetical protein